MLFVNSVAGSESYFNDDSMLEYYRARFNNQSEMLTKRLKELEDFIYKETEEDKRYFVLEYDVIIRM